MNFNLESILVPVDLSENSLNALNTAIELAKKHKAKLIVLNVVEPKLSRSDTILNVVGLSNSKDVLNALLGSIYNSHELMPVLIQKEGTVYEQIIQQGFYEQVDLIVMGTHGASGFREGFVGSNTYAVMKHSFCPVLVIPPQEKYMIFKNILFPVRPVSGALSYYNVLCHFLNPGAIINVLGLSHRKIERETSVLKKIVDEIREHADRDKVHFKTEWGNGDGVSDDVLRSLQQFSPDLMVITNVLDVTTKQGFLGPHTQKIVNYSKVPVLSIKSIKTPHYT